MATLKDAVRTTLEGDATLSAILTGGVYDASEVERDGVTADNVQRDANGRVKPFAVLRWRGSAPDFVLGTHEAERRYLEVWLYEDTGYTNIDAAERRIKTLLHRKTFADTDNEGLAWARWVHDLGESSADELGGASASMSRYEIVLTRK